MHLILEKDSLYWLFFILIYDKTKAFIGKIVR